ncbi:hypothetical protein [Agrococcus sp. KRD186]|uniref:hypothetical protein n=1 Tax=Agrococcus sp. KRD186 TaxID=2729730 RepID=UPI0019D1DB2B|nr:hypothetical protein [Agrococcus sp. KRD186]
MVPASPAEALGGHAQTVKHLVVESVRHRHARFAEAHEVSGSRYTMGFGAQWRDQLDDVQEALSSRGYRTYKLPPAGYKLPVVNDCLVYVWRVPGSDDVVTTFASSPTRVNGFSTPLLDPQLFEPGDGDELEVESSSENRQLEQVARAASGVMPLLLVMIQSSPRQLQSIEWAVAELDTETGEVTLHGQESIWEPDVTQGDASTDVESFASGTPAGPAVEPRELEGKGPDA